MARPRTAPPQPLPTSPLGWVRFTWGVLGVTLVLLNPIVRLSAKPIEAVAEGLTPGQWALAVVWVAFMLYSEAWRGFHKQFAPRVVARALALAHHGPLVPSLLAPFTCMGLLWATRKRKTIAWVLISVIVAMVMAVRTLEQPWRGIIDMGVVLGLVSGLGSVLWFAGRALAGQPPPIDPDLPESVARPADATPSAASVPQSSHGA